MPTSTLTVESPGFITVIVRSMFVFTASSILKEVGATITFASVGV